jgi:phage gpG-like protein
MSAALDRVRAALERHKKLFDLTEDALGRKLCKAATDGVQECIADEKTPDGQAWVPLSEHYEEWKSFHYPGNPMAVLKGIMANPREVAGEVVVRPDHAVVTYGVTDEAREHATWFQEGGGRPGHGQPARPFWGFTSASLDEVREILDERFRTV